MNTNLVSAPAGALPFQSSIVEISNEGQLTVSSLILAEGLGITHRVIIATIKKYVERIERFGRVLFEKIPLKTKGGNQQVTIVRLNEDQALFVGSLSNNTDQVLDFKATLIEEFSKAKKMLLEKSNPLLEKFAALVKVNNDLQKRLITIEREVGKVQKAQLDYFEAKAYDEDTKYDQEMLVRRTRIMSMVQMKLRCAPNLKWSDFWESFYKTYDVSVYTLQQDPGEHPLDTVIRHGYITQLEELLDC